jgi:aldehyde dehydrogenase (NAD+)
MLGAIAAGNTVVIKPSEMCPASEKILAELLPKYIDSDSYRVVCGDVPVTSALLKLQWDKIFFTGSTRVGKIVMKAAAEFLTPVSLELGGKSPTIIHESVTDIELAATRVLWGKSVNAGQTCIAPDYVFCHEKHYDRFLACLKEKSLSFYGKEPQQSKDYARIVSPAHFNRLNALLTDSRAQVYSGGRTDEKDKFIEVTVLKDVKKESKIMQEEIFGPILPVMVYRDIQEVIDYVNSGDKPLTMYLFGKDRQWIDRMTDAVPSGSIVVNDVLFQFANVFAPFGGVGASGMGNYHGKYSFDCFSYKRSILRRDDHRLLDAPIRYPPYGPYAVTIFKSLVKLPAMPHMTVSTLLMVLMTAVALPLAGLKYFGKI